MAESPSGRGRYDLGPERGQGLVDVLDRILDKGLVVAGDIRVKLADVELLTIQIRLLVCSVDKAEEIGLDWWKTDPRLSRSASDSADAGNGRLMESLSSLEARMETLQRRLDEVDAGSADEDEKPEEGGSVEETGGKE